MRVEIAVTINVSLTLKITEFLLPLIKVVLFMFTKSLTKSSMADIRPGGFLLQLHT